MNYIEQLKQFLEEEGIVDSDGCIHKQYADICGFLIVFARYLEEKNK